MPPAPLIRLMNVKFSPNLGDGLLSDCLEAGLRARGAAAGSIDLAARTGYGQGLAGRGRVLRLLEAMPPGLRAQAVRAPLALASARRWAPHYARELAGATAMVIGGGNLLSDHDLNFPTKLALALTAARDRGLPVAFHACGMAADWSAEGDRRLRRALAGVDLRAVFLRDAPSCARWDARFAEATGQRARQVRDPGLLTALTWALPPRAPDAAAPIGLCVMSHLALRYHAQTTLGAADLLRWYRALARRLCRDGARLRVFTNGAPEDRETLALLAPDLRALGAEIVQPETPADLAAVIAPCAALIAFRMHAVIAAYASRVPVLALKWDDKLDAFLASVGQEGWLADAARLAPEAAAARVGQLAAKGGDFSRHPAVIAEAGADLDRLLAALSAGPTPKTR
ncbi:polysaccharide pyruvyl transferase family protein [Rhodobacter capsulatus]|uniref:Polysaccharide pyruvyl transferase n=1 Tax=Rhodobacter capsulatus TaxID=1061 RepID=A0A1G7J8Q7_RHOCA|nr:polysaccharide pyruvyl transferase family protein [Rhodobacter capsulatus]WER07767.1 polysaccharide pyruvyl transferase family protein [Rhodobacter capsulatus]SDF21275.1 Polysaccharide pyruvyl transferase [Rhodobacter capsulatus]